MPTVVCPKGCGKTGFPGPMARHAAACDGTPKVQGGGNGSKPRKVRAEKAAAPAPAPAALVRRDAPVRVMKILSAPGVKVRSVADVRAAIGQLVQDCETTLATLEMMDALSTWQPVGADR